MSLTQVRQLAIKLNVLKKRQPEIIYKKSESEQRKLKDLKQKIKNEKR
jgi:hypothetical protein